MKELDRIMLEIDELKSRSAKLEETVKAMREEEKPAGSWVPRVEERYYYDTGAGEVCWLWWLNSESDKKHLSFNNVYKTEEEAQREVDRKKLIADLRREAGYYKPVWDNNNNTAHWFIVYDNNIKAWAWLSCLFTDICPSSGYFAKPIDGLIKKYADRLHLLREA